MSAIGAREAAAATSPTRKAATKLGSVAPIPQSGGSTCCTWSTHQFGPVGERYW